MAMPMLTSDMLVRVVTELSRQTRTIVPAKAVLDWCRRHNVDYQGAGLNYQTIWDADVNEARGQRRLRKFKRGWSSQSRVGWTLIELAPNASQTLASADWHEVSWNGKRWVW